MKGSTVTSKNEQSNSPKASTPAQPPASFRDRFLAGLKETAIVLGLFILINNFVIASFLVPTGSMENEVMTGELLFVNKFIYGATTPRTVPLTGIELGFFTIPPVRLPWVRLPAFAQVERGDVIVFEFPGYRDELRAAEFQFYLKRCVGLPGDTIRIVNRVLMVNGQQFPIPRNMKFDRPWPVPAEVPDERIFPKGAPWNEDHYGPLVIPYAGMKITLAESNVGQWDTFIRREGHSVRSENGGVLIDGARATEYVVERDYLFGMGDHRDNSLDSRFWGFIPKENLVGTPLIVYWSWNTDIPLYDIFSRLGSVRWGRLLSLVN
jgi:signal peptidase I